MLTWWEAKSILAKYYGRAGTCATDPRLDLFVREVLQHMLFKGQYGNLRKFCFCAHLGCFTVPYELEVPLKLKINDRVGTSFDRWFEFHSTAHFDEQCIPAALGLREDPNYYPTVYPLPAGGARIGVNATVQEKPGAFVIVKGKDPTGREIVTSHNGQQVVGEVLEPCYGQIIYTNATFGEVTEVIKSPTIGYLNLLWINLVTNKKGFLADYSPLEEKPSYRRYVITSPCCQEPVKVSVLGRIRLKPAYTNSDLIPFESIHSINLAGQEVQHQLNNAPDLAKAKGESLTQEIEDENSYKRDQVGSPIEVYHPLSGGAIQGIVSGSYGAIGWNWRIK